MEIIISDMPINNTFPWNSMFGMLCLWTLLRRRRRSSMRPRRAMICRQVPACVKVWTDIMDITYLFDTYFTSCNGRDYPIKR